MPSLRYDESRHAVVIRKRGQYRSFPDVCLTQAGHLLAVHRKAERHVAQRPTDLFSQTSTDGGASWSAPRLLAKGRGHCPRLTVLPDGTLLCLDDAPTALFRSEDHGRNWAVQELPGIRHGLPDRPLLLADGRWFSTFHAHRGFARPPAIGQAPTEQLTFVSENAGQSWHPWSVAANSHHLVLCEASTVQLPDGSLFMLLRENSFVGEPMYALQSFDGGVSWTDPQPTPLLGHRPTMARTRSGKLLVTYRNLGPEPGTAAFLGTPAELGARADRWAAPSSAAQFQVHGPAIWGNVSNADLPASLCSDGLLLQNQTPADGPVRYALRPMSDPDTASATLEAWVRVLSGKSSHAFLRLGVWWILTPTSIKPLLPGARPLSLPQGRVNHIRLEYVPGTVSCFVNNRKKRPYSLPRGHRALRPILFGAGHPTRKEYGRSLWTRLKLTIDEPRYLRAYAWEWNPEHGQPDNWVRERVLELLPAHGASFADFGYSGWAETAPGQFCCVYHHADGRESGYGPGKRSWVVATRFNETDFTNMS